MKNKYFVLQCLLLGGAITFAQENQVFNLTLKQAQEYALNNYQLNKNAKLDVESAKSKIWETTAIGLPQVSGSARYEYIPGDIPNFELPEEFGGPQPIAEKNNITYNASVNQLIFSGEYLVGLQASKAFLLLSQNAGTKTELDLKESVSSSYFTYLALLSNKEILDSSVNNIRNLHRETQALYNTGFVGSVEVDQLQLNLQTQENALRTIERQVRISDLLFKIQLGLKPENSVKLTDNLQDLLTSFEISTYENIDFDLNQNIDYRISDNNVLIQNLNVKRQKSLYLPSISGFYQFQDKLNKPLVDFSIPHMLGLSLDVPIFTSGMKNARLQQAKIELEKSQNNRELAANNLLMSAEQARFDLANALDKYNTEKSNLELSKKIYNNTTIQFKNGVVTSIELTQAQNQYLNSVSNYTNSIIQLLTAKIGFDKTYNQL